MADQGAIDKLRRNLGDGGTTQAFTDPELSAILDEAEGDPLTAVVQGLWELTVNSVRLSDYTAGLSQERKSQVFDHLKALWQERRAELDSRDNGASEGLSAISHGQTISVATRSVW